MASLTRWPRAGQSCSEEDGLSGSSSDPRVRSRAYVYYRCPHKPANPRHHAAAPDHPRSVQVLPVTEDCAIEVAVSVSEAPRGR